MQRNSIHWPLEKEKDMEAGKLEEHGEEGVRRGGGGEGGSH